MSVRISLLHPRVSRVAQALAIVAAVFLPSAAHADAAYQMIRIQCLPALGKVTVDTFTEWNACSDVSCENLRSLGSQGVYEAGAFLNRFRRTPFSCLLPDRKTAILRISDHGVDKTGNTWLRLEFELGNLVAGSIDTSGSNVDAWMENISNPASVAFRVCTVPEDAFMGLSQPIHCDQRWINYNGHAVIDGAKNSQDYTPSTR